MGLQIARRVCGIANSEVDSTVDAPTLQARLRASAPSDPTPQVCTAGAGDFFVD